jgi:hypothetical protein
MWNLMNNYRPDNSMRVIFKRAGVKPGNQAFETGFLMGRTTLFFQPILLQVYNLCITSEKPARNQRETSE